MCRSAPASCGRTGRSPSGGAALLSPCCGHAADDLGTMTFPPEASPPRSRRYRPPVSTCTSTSTATVRRGWCWTPTPPRSRRPGSAGRRHVLAHNSMVDPPMSTGTRSSASSPTAPRCGDRLQRPVPRHLHRDARRRAGGGTAVPVRRPGPLRRDRHLRQRHPRRRHPGDPATHPDRGAAHPAAPGASDDLPLVARQRIGLHDAARLHRQRRLPAAVGPPHRHADHRQGRRPDRPRRRPVPRRPARDPRRAGRADDDGRPDHPRRR